MRNRFYDLPCVLQERIVAYTVPLLVQQHAQLLHNDVERLAVILRWITLSERTAYFRRYLFLFVVHVLGQPRRAVFPRAHWSRKRDGARGPARAAFACTTVDALHLECGWPLREEAVRLVEVAERGRLTRRPRRS